MLCLSIRQCKQGYFNGEPTEIQSCFEGFTYIHVVRQDAIRIYYFRNQGHTF